MAFEIISNLEVQDLGRLPAVSQSMVDFSCNQTSDRKNRWLIVPWVSLRRNEDLAPQMYRIWPPCIIYMEARYFKMADASWLIDYLDQPSDGGRGLQYLDLSFSKLPKDNSLPHYVRASLCLRELNLHHCQMDSKALKRLTEGLTLNNNGRIDPSRSLRDLNLRDNEIQSDGAAHIATLIQHLPLKRLVLAKNNLQNEGAELLVPALRLNKDLLDLDISQNSLSALGVVVLIEALETNSTLRLLNVGGHPTVGSMRIEELATAVGKASGLKELHLWRCGLQDQAFDTIMGSKPVGMRLNLASNHLSCDLKMRLLEMERASAVFAETLGEVQF